MSNQNLTSKVLRDYILDRKPSDLEMKTVENLLNYGADPNMNDEVPESTFFIYLYSLLKDPHAREEQKMIFNLFLDYGSILYENELIYLFELLFVTYRKCHWLHKVFQEYWPNFHDAISFSSPRNKEQVLTNKELDDFLTRRRSHGGAANLLENFSCKRLI